ncbi:partitioning defective 3 homolog B isoform X2 [Coregonus clupeaformis]|uniref:partitioning defective 3 homolog B isoform X2 n=1 Tax=Coregonus clupeaformis TaxID=59861 RepID=UPI001E1C9953|nr:partitioning defective 3 homolog B isoform X2 [Coregonus clupeaformis]
MKVTVTFGATAVVVPCKGEWTVRELIDQANQRYRKILEQNGEDFLVRTHHVEYCDGGILDLDDLLTDLVEDRDKLVAVFEAQELQRGATVSPVGSSGGSTGHSSPSHYSKPDPYERQTSYLQPIRGGEIEVNASTLKANTPLLVRSSSDSALAPPLEIVKPPPDDLNARPAETDASHALTHRGEPKDRLRLDIPTTAKMSRVTLSPLTKTVELSGEQGPLGIHVVPYCSSLSGRTLGLHIKSIEANSRSKREGIFQEDECIVQINGTELMDKTFAQSQEVFRQAMSSPLVRLEVLPLANKQRYEKRLIGQLFTDGHDSVPKAKSPLMIHRKMDAKPEVKPETVKPEQINPKLEPRRPDLHVLRSKTPDLPASLTLQGEHQTGHIPEERPLSVSPAVRDRDGASPTVVGGNESPLPQEKSPTWLPNLTNQMGGRKLKIDLKKGTEGLGFTVVTRDSTVHGPGPILIKNILPRGAAIKDGRLQTGDHILEVNGVDMTDRTQEELVAMLRSTKQGECVSVLVARQEEIFLPRVLKGEEASPLLLEDGREQLMFEVPLNDTGSAGLGISLKGNKSREKGEDLGIFIKSIIHGGAAYKDGRLRVNDQLIAVNGEALLGRSNHAAMETLRHSMSWEGNARGTIQLVLLRPAASSGSAHNTTANAQESQEVASPQSHQVPDGPSGPPAPATAPESHRHSNGPSPQLPSQPPMVPNNIYYSFRAPPTSGGHAHYKEEEEMEEDFPSPPSTGAVEEMNAKLQNTTHPHRSEWNKAPYIPEGPLHPDTQTAQQPRQTDNPRTRNSKSMDLVADESNMRSLAEQRPVSSSRESDLGPTLGLWKSCSLESLQSAVSEARQLSQQSKVPFHRPRPHMVRGRGCNQSFRVAIDKSYDGPSEPEDDDLSEQSSGRDTPASGSSRQDQIESEEGKKKKKKKKTKGKKKSKEKVKKKTEDSEDHEKKAKKKGFGLLRFGKKKEAKSKAEVNAAKQKFEVLSEEELDKIEERVRHDLRNMEVRDGHVTPDPLPPDMEDDDQDPNYARINTFREPPKGPSPSYLSRTPSPQRALGGPPPAGPSHSRQPSAEDLEGLYAKVNKQRAPPSTSTSQLQPPLSDSERVQKLRRELQQARAAPAYEELEVTRRRALDYDPPRMAVRGPDTRPAPRYEDVERQYAAQSRRADPKDYPIQSRTAPGYPGRDNYYPPREAQPHPSSLPRAISPPQVDPRYYPSLPHQHRAAHRQDVPPTTGTRNPRYETVGRGGYRDASPGRFASPDRSGGGYRDGRQPDPRQKNAMIGAV